MKPTRSHEFDENPYASPRGEVREGASSAADSDSQEDRKAYDRSLSRAVRYALIQQTIALIIAALVLDGGDTFRLAAMAAIMSFAPIVMIAVQRVLSQHYALSRLDRAIIRYGFWVFLLGMFLLYTCELLPDGFYFSKRIGRPPAASR